MHDSKEPRDTIAGMVAMTPPTSETLAAVDESETLMSLLDLVRRVPIAALMAAGITAGLTCAGLVIFMLRSQDGTTARHRAGGRSGKYDRADGSSRRGSRRRKRRPNRAMTEDDEWDPDEDELDDDDDVSALEEALQSPRSWVSRSDGASPRGAPASTPVWVDDDSGMSLNPQLQPHGARDRGNMLGAESIPAIYKTAEGACAVDIPLDGVSTVRALLEAIVHLGQAMVDADISASTIKVHYATEPGVKPIKVMRDTTLCDLRDATGLVVTPR